MSTGQLLAIVFLLGLALVICLLSSLSLPRESAETDVGPTRSRIGAIAANLVAVAVAVALGMLLINAPRIMRAPGAAADEGQLPPMLAGTSVQTPEASAITAASSSAFLLVFALLALIAFVWWLSSREGETDPWVKMATRWSKIAMLLVGVLAASFEAVKAFGEAGCALRACHEKQGHDTAAVGVERALLLGLGPTAPASFTQGPAPLATFLVEFGEAGCTPGLPPDQWPGVSPSPEMEGYLHSLAERLSACGTSSDKVQLRVLGFASSSPLEHVEHCASGDATAPLTSDDVNLRIAQARADRVASTLRAACSGKPCSNVEVTAHSWGNDFDEMTKWRRFNDRFLSSSPGSSASYSVKRGLLNRRVEVRIEDAAECELKAAADTEASLRPAPADH